MLTDTLQVASYNCAQSLRKTFNLSLSICGELQHRSEHNLMISGSLPYRQAVLLEVQDGLNSLADACRSGDMSHAHACEASVWALRERLLRGPADEARSGAHAQAAGGHPDPQLEVDAFTSRHWTIPAVHASPDRAVQQEQLQEGPNGVEELSVPAQPLPAGFIDDICPGPHDPQQEEDGAGVRPRGGSVTGLPEASAVSLDRDGRAVDESYANSDVEHPAGQLVERADSPSSATGTAMVAWDGLDGLVTLLEVEGLRHQSEQLQAELQEQVCVAAKGTPMSLTRLQVTKYGSKTCLHRKPSHSW